ncbi:hypothetical protein [Helicobacter saguini]|nr:hypothetical protein [Helicobacter saguini]
MQRKGGDSDGKDAKMLQFKINSCKFLR